jgi:hypothetical protein
MTGAVRQPDLGFGPPPPGITMVTVDPASGGIATPSCPRSVALPFLSGTEPTQMCQLHGGSFAGAVAGAITTAAGAVGLGPGATGSPIAGGAPPSSGTASNNVFGAVGNFFGALFGHKSAPPSPSASP